MTNEEIVARIQAGEHELMETLWNQVSGLVKWKANQVITALDGRCGVEFGDLYDSGYLATVDAVGTYNQERGAFHTWMMFYVKSAFAKATGFRTQRAKKDPMQTAMSLSSPVGDDEDNGELIDLIPDPNSKRAMERVEEQIWNKQLHKVFEDVFSEISEEQGKVLRHRYYAGCSIVETGKELGLPVEDVRRLERTGLQAMRHPRMAKKLRPFFDFDYFYGTSLGAFKITGTSVQERYLIHMER